MASSGPNIATKCKDMAASLRDMVAWSINLISYGGDIAACGRDPRVVRYGADRS